MIINKINIEGIIQEQNELIIFDGADLKKKVIK